MQTTLIGGPFNGRVIETSEWPREFVLTERKGQLIPVYYYRHVIACRCGAEINIYVHKG